jgi:hypothetical protein
MQRLAFCVTAASWTNFVSNFLELPIGFILIMQPFFFLYLRQSCSGMAVKSAWLQGNFDAQQNNKEVIFFVECAKLRVLPFPVLR